MQRDSKRILAADLQGVFDPTRFSIARSPAQVGRLPHYDGPILPSCLDMLIKMPLGEIRLPKSYRGIEAIEHFVRETTKSHALYKPRWNESCYLYLTVDNRNVKEGKTHRNRGWHFDGMQGRRYPDKLPVCHQYVASTCLPAEYYVGNDIDLVDMSEDENWFSEIDRQIPDNAPVVQFADHDIVLMSAYQAHRSVPAKEEVPRLFLRLDISHKRQDRLGNTENPDLMPPWPMVERHFEKHEPVCDTGWE